ncbi:MAG: DUF6298 domain-containing protein [Marinilabiliales bacterium]|nr:DUF6298 domain-containing protein [Marinilabiliales bacterium]
MADHPSKGDHHGKRHEVPWWRGDARPYDTSQAKPAITRFAPGRSGTGYTDDLSGGRCLDDFQPVPGCWNTIMVFGTIAGGMTTKEVRRADGMAWAPFYELPFARSGLRYRLGWHEQI